MNIYIYTYIYILYISKSLESEDHQRLWFQAPLKSQVNDRALVDWQTTKYNSGAASSQTYFNQEGGWTAINQAEWTPGLEALHAGPDEAGGTWDKDWQNEFQNQEAVNLTGHAPPEEARIYDPNVKEGDLGELIEADVQAFLESIKPSES